MTGFRLRRVMQDRAVGGLLAMFACGAVVALAYAGVALGPNDGAGLPPTDLGRVAIGDLAPDFTLESKDGDAVTLSSFRARKNVVLVFYRGQW